MGVGNKANCGGALFVRENCIVNVSDCGFYNNSAIASGGAILMNLNSTLSLSKSSLESTNQFVKGSN